MLGFGSPSGLLYPSALDHRLCGLDWCSQGCLIHRPFYEDLCATVGTSVSFGDLLETPLCVLDSFYDRATLRRISSGSSFGGSWICI